MLEMEKLLQSLPGQERERVQEIIRRVLHAFEEGGEGAALATAAELLGVSPEYVQTVMRQWRDATHDRR